MPQVTGTPRFPYVMFDLGSTLIYFEGDWDVIMPRALEEATQYLRSLGHDVDPRAFPAAYSALVAEYYQKRNDTFLEYTSQFVLEEAFRAHSLPVPSEEHLLDTLRVFYRVTQQHWHLEPDAVPMLQTLRAQGCRLGIISNASDDEDVQTLVDKAGIRMYFDFILTSARAGVRKPNPRIFHQALGYWGARPEQSVMVGDLVLADVAGANPLGIASVWIKRRADTAENRAALQEFRPGATISTLSELPGVLEQWA